jgi:small-conductance mechanosensitive channel
MNPIEMFFLQASPAPMQRDFDQNLLWNSLHNLWVGFLGQLPYIVFGFIVFVVFLVVARILKRVVHAAGERTRLDLTLADLLGRLASFLITVLGLFVAAVIIFPAFKPGDLITGLGITSVAIGFAFKDVLQNFFSGILILWRRPFIVGDQIRAREYEGTVEEITVRSTRLRTYDGERAVLPNGDVYTHAVLVRTAYDKRRVKFTVGIGYPDSIEEARRTIKRVLNETEGVFRDPVPWVHVTELAPSSVNFTVYFWVQSDQVKVLDVSDRVATGIKLALDSAGIDMPFPHRVVLFHNVTGTRDGDVVVPGYPSEIEPNGESQVRS